MKYYILALLLATSVEANMVRNTFLDKRSIAKPDATGKFSQVNCGTECCPCASCCSCPCGSGAETKDTAALEAAN